MFEELSLNILDIAMNSLAAGATKLQIAVLESTRRDRLSLRIRDNGCGMDAATLERVLNQNRSGKQSRKKPIGLGLALLRQTAEMCDGQFTVRSAPGQGTAVQATMQLAHVDRPPLGDLSGTMVSLCSTCGCVDVQFAYRGDGQRFSFSSNELQHKEGNADEPRRTQEAEGKSAAASRAA